jgi:hypothetical protein
MIDNVNNMIDSMLDSFLASNGTIGVRYTPQNVLFWTIIILSQSIDFDEYKAMIHDYLEFAVAYEQYR